MSDEEIIKQLKDSCNNYRQTVLAIKAVAHEFLWDDSANQLISGGKAYLGRRMDTSDSNIMSPHTQVTPDIVVQRTETYGLVGEAKVALPKNTQYREDTVVGIQKYDDNLVGWITEDGLIKNHDVILIVHYLRGKEVERLVKQLLNTGKVRFGKNFGLICFSVVEQRETWMCLELLFGSLSDDRKRQKLENRLPISLQYVVGSPNFAKVQLYDAEPPYPLLMDMTHEVILSGLTNKENQILREDNVVRKEISVSELRMLLAESFSQGAGDRLPEIPKTAWVRNVMDFFEELGWAEKKDEKGETYVYEIRYRRNSFEQYLKLCARKEEEKKQLLLFQK